MAITDDTIARAGAAILDTAEGSTFAERLTSISEAFRVLLGPIDVGAFTYNKAALLAAEAGPRLPRIDFRTERLWGTNSDAVELMRCEYAAHWAPLDPVAPVAGVNTHKAFNFSWNYQGPNAFEVDFLRRMGVAHQLVGGLETFGDQGLALLVNRGPDQPGFTRSEQLATELVYDHVLLAVRSLMLREQLDALADPAGEGGDVGTLVLSDRGELVAWNSAGRAMAASIHDPEGTWLGWLVHQVVAVAAEQASRSSGERVFTLPKAAGGWAEMRLSRLDETPVRVLASFRSLAPGTAGHFAAAVAHAGLTAREREVARLSVQGLSNREIGLELGIQPRTVGVHLAAVYVKVGVGDRQALRVRVLGSG